MTNIMVIQCPHSEPICFVRVEINFNIFLHLRKKGEPNIRSPCAILILDSFWMERSLTFVHLDINRRSLRSERTIVIISCSTSHLGSVQEDIGQPHPSLGLLMLLSSDVAACVAMLVKICWYYCEIFFRYCLWHC